MKKIYIPTRTVLSLGLAFGSASAVAADGRTCKVEKVGVCFAAQRKVNEDRVCKAAWESEACQKAILQLNQCDQLCPDWRTRQQGALPASHIRELLANRAAPSAEESKLDSFLASLE